jgi:integrase
MMAKIEAPVLANQVLAAASAIFSWAIKQEIIVGRAVVAGKEVVVGNPCHGIERHETRSRERVLSDSELPLFWQAFDAADLVRGSALKVILLTGQRPGEVACMRREHIIDGWWQMPGEPVPAIGWPGTKNSQSHGVWLCPAVREIIAELTDDKAEGFVFASIHGRPITNLAAAMALICAKLGVERATPHDLRRTFSTKVTGLGYGREALNRVTNHREGGIASVYDRYRYGDENKKIMGVVAKHILALAEGESKSNVVELKGNRK